MDQISGTTPTDGPKQAQDSQAADPAGPGEFSPAGEPGFGSRGRARRRARFLRKARELAYRDLGGLVYNLHRFGQRNDALVLAKLTTLEHIDGELRAIEASLQEREPVTVLREAGITACPRCAAIHSSEDRFCPNCGLSMSRHVDLPVAGAPAAVTPSSSPAAAPPSAPVPAPAPAVDAPPPAEPAQRPATAPPVNETHAPVPAQQDPSSSSGGRAPKPPMSSSAPSERMPVSSENAPGDVEEATEIIRPGASGS